MISWEWGFSDHWAGAAILLQSPQAVAGAIRPGVDVLRT